MDLLYITLYSHYLFIVVEFNRNKRCVVFTVFNPACNPSPTLTKVLLLLKRNHRGDLQCLDSAPTMHHVHLPVTSAYLLAANGNYDARELNSDGNYVPENSASG